MKDATQRFDTRVQDYLRGRHGYPRQTLDVIRAASTAGAPATLADWRLNWTVADIGAGTGLMSEPFLEAGCTVHGIEPSAPMAEAGRQTLSKYPAFTMHEGRAEATGLEDASVDVVVTGQAFHWFDAEAAAVEWRRILKPGGTVAVIWNRRRRTGNPFQVAYDTFMKSWGGEDYAKVIVSYEVPATLSKIFDPLPEPVDLPNANRLDSEGLQSLLRSCSYMPARGEENYESMVRAGKGLFDAHQVGGRVELGYDTVIFAGRLRSPA